MGKSFSTSFRVEFRDTNLACGKTHADIVSKVDGTPVYVRQWKRRVNADKLEAWRHEMNRANPGTYIDFARIVHFETGHVICEIADTER